MVWCGVVYCSIICIFEILQSAILIRKTLFENLISQLLFLNNERLELLTPLVQYNAYKTNLYKKQYSRMIHKCDHMIITNQLCMYMYMYVIMTLTLSNAAFVNIH